MTELYLAALSRTPSEEELKLASAAFNAADSTRQSATEENEDVQLLFEDSWYWLHYRFFNCRDAVCSEASSLVRTHLYNLVAMLYKRYEALPTAIRFDQEKLRATIDETISIAEYSRSFPASLWIYGDENSKAFLDEWIAPLPPPAGIEHLLKLPHFRRMEMERLPYSYGAEEQALKRYRNELAAFKRKKTATTSRQHTTTAEPGAGAHQFKSRWRAAIGELMR